MEIGNYYILDSWSFTAIVMPLERIKRPNDPNLVEYYDIADSLISNVALISKLNTSSKYDTEWSWHDIRNLPADSNYIKLDWILKIPISSQSPYFINWRDYPMESKE